MDCLAGLEDSGKIEELCRIRDHASDAIPDERMRTLWRLLLSGRVDRVGQEVDLYGWRKRFARDGLTPTLRLELCDLLTPRVSLREPFRWSVIYVEDEDAPTNMRRLVDWDIVLTVRHVHSCLEGWDGNQNWTSVLGELLPDFTKLLRDALDLMRELGGADEKSDLSYANQPSISEHAQNKALQDWTALIDLNRDAWLATAAASPKQARLAAQAWAQVSYPLFRRLAFFAASHDVVPHSEGLAWLLADEHWWLWSVETQREAMRLLIALSPQLDEDELNRLEGAILAGPPREMYRAEIEPERWVQLRDRSVWLRLAKISQARADLGADARQIFAEFSARYPDLRLSENEREEFPTWTGDGSELRIHVTTPRDRDELIEWLRENPEPDDWREDDWHDRCRDDYDNTSWALKALAQDEVWPTGRWREALQRWSEDELIEQSWRDMAPVVERMPCATMQELSHGVSWWLESLARTFEGQEETFFSLCDRILALEYELEEDYEDVVGRAINHPVGLATEALLHRWYRTDPKNNEGLADEMRLRFTRLCNTEVLSLSLGRVLLAANVISLFRVDPEWTIQFVLPLFKWGDFEAEARLAWAGFLWSPRLYGPFMEVLKPAFLDTVNHYDQLGREGEQYASMLVFVGLDRRDFFRSQELALATRALPRKALEHGAKTIFRAVDSAGDQRSDYWRNRGAPYMELIWPRSHDANSATISENLARACIAAGDAFKEALEQIRFRLQTLEYSEEVAHALHGAELDTRFPKGALELLDLIVGDEAQGDFRGLEACLRAIRDTETELVEDHRFRRLVEVLRANGGNLN